MKRIISTLIVAAVAALSSADAFAGSRVIIDQYGSFNGVGAVQQGNNIFIRLYQKHRHNNAIIQQYGDGNVSVTGQDGRWNSSNSLQNGYGNVNGTAQIGNGNKAKTKQTGTNNVAGTIQVGNGNDASTNQYGNGNVSLVIQGN